MISTEWCFTFRLFGFFMIGVTGTVLLIAAAVVVAMRNRQQPAPPPDAPVAASPAEVRVKAVERNVETLDFSNAEAAKLSCKG